MAIHQFTTLSKTTSGGFGTPIPAFQMHKQQYWQVAVWCATKTLLEMGTK